MVEMICPMTGTVLFVAEERVEKYEAAGYKCKTKRKAAKPKETEEKPKETEE